MMNLNRATIIGNLTRDPELRNTAGGRAVTSFGVATNRVWTDQQGQKQEEVEFHNIVAWGKLAEICSQYLGKGRKVYVEGRLRTRDWEGQDGVKRQRTEIIADNIIMLDRAPGGAPGAAAPKNGNPQGAAPQQAEQLDEIQIEDIPF